MAHRSTILILVLAAMPLIAAPALAQFPASTQRNLLPASVPYLGDESLRKELRLTEEQTRKLTDLQRRHLVSSSTASRGTTTRGQELNQEIEKAFADVLQPEQIKRLNQIVLQELERRYGFYRVAGFTEVADSLKLTAEQQAQFTGLRGPTLAEVLTADQQTKWKELIGTPFGGPLQSTSPFSGFTPGGLGTRSRFSSVPAMTELTYLETPEVQQELKLTPEQLRELDAVVARRETALISYRTLAVAERTKQRETADQAAREAIAKLLRPEQATRFRQIKAQQEQKQIGELDFLRSAAIRDGLKLTPPQAEKMDALVKACRETMRQAVLSADPADRIEAKLVACQKETREALLAVLSETQRKGINEVLGEPFTMPVRDSRGTWGRGLPGGGPAGPGAFPGFGRDATVGTGEFGRFSSLTGTLLTNEAVQKELKLTESQLREVDRLARLPSGTEQSATTIGTVLNAAQASRLRELRLQQVARIAGPVCVFRYREVVEAVQLTDEQKTQLSSLLQEAVSLYISRVREGADTPVAEETRQNAEKQLAAVLSADQQQKLAALYGEPFKGALAQPLRPAPAGPVAPPAGGLPGGLPARGFPSSSSRNAELGTASNLTVSLLSVPGVQKELRLTPTQIQKVPELMGTRTFGTPTVAVEEVARVLNADQVTRLQQLSLQQMERLAGAGYLLRCREVLEELQPSEEQVTKLQALLEEVVQTHARRLVSGEALAEAERIKARARFEEVLTKEQRGTLTDLLGEPFVGELPVQTPSRSGFDRGSRGTTSFARRVPTHSLLRLLSQTDILQELKLTAAQRTRLEEVESKRSAALRDYGTLAPTERSKKLAAENETADREIASILDARQTLRIKQIRLQERPEATIDAGLGLPEGASVFLEADVVAELGITAEQQKSIREIVANGVKVRTLIQRQNWGEMPPPVAEHQTAVEERLRGVLSKEQLEKWKAMVGEPFQRRFAGFGVGGP